MKRILLDGNLINEIPDGIDSFVESFIRDKDLRVMNFNIDGKLRFFNDGYEYLKGQFESGFCGEVEIDIQEMNIDNNLETIFTGIIHLSACEFYIAPDYISCQLDDNSYFARIYKNKGLKAPFISDRSKNDITIDLPQHELVEFFTPSTGAYDYSNRWVYPIGDVFRFLIEWMSDGDVGYDSDVFSSTGIYSDYGIILGAELRAGDVNSHDKQPEISFSDFVTEINKKFNIFMKIEYAVSGKPILKINDYDSTLNDAQSGYAQTKLDNIREIKHTIDTNKLYATMKIGSDKTYIGNGDVQFPEPVKLDGFIEESVPFLGQCNQDIELDLLSSYIVSSNVIENIVVNNLEENDSDIVIIQYDRTTLKANKSNWISSAPPYYYNEGLNNKSTINRHLDKIPSAIAKYYSRSTDHGFHASPSIDRGIHYNDLTSAGKYAGFLPDDDFSGINYDETNDYGGGTAQGTLIPSFDKARYTAYADGFIRFAFYYHAIITSHQRVSGLGIPSSSLILVSLKRFNSSDVFQEQRDYTQLIPPEISSPYELRVGGNFGMQLNTGDYVRVHNDFILLSGINTNRLYFNVLKDSYFKTSFTSYGVSGIYAQTNIAEFNGHLFQFKSPIDKYKFKQIKENITAAIYFNTNGLDNIKGWIEQIKFYREKGYADITVSTNQQLIKIK